MPLTPHIAKARARESVDLMESRANKLFIYDIEGLQRHIDYLSGLKFSRCSVDTANNRLNEAVTLDCALNSAACNTKRLSNVADVPTSR